jgi:hypothetical protein
MIAFPLSIKILNFGLLPRKFNIKTGNEIEKETGIAKDATIPINRITHLLIIESLSDASSNEKPKRMSDSMQIVHRINKKQKLSLR